MTGDSKRLHCALRQQEHAGTAAAAGAVPKFVTAVAVRKWRLDTYSFVVLFYDKEGKSIGIKPVKTEEDGAHKLNLGKGKKSAWVSCRKFFDFFDIPIQDTKRFDDTFDEKERMIIVQLP